MKVSTSACPEEKFRFPMKDPYQIDRSGIIHVPEKPGPGIEFDWIAIDNNCVTHDVRRA